MLRSMYSGVSGLRGYQTMIDVVGNNIANVNTIGFKGGQTVFQDLLSQTLQGAGLPAQGGGTNPAQIGLGMRLAGTTTSFAQGGLQNTGRPTDMSIQGDGFFVVRRGTDQFYTRAGAFTLDGNGRLASPQGTLVQGWSADAQGLINPNGPIGDILMPVGALINPQVTKTVTVGGNLPANANPAPVPPATTPPAAVISSSITIYDDNGAAKSLTMEFTRAPLSADPATQQRWYLMLKADVNSSPTSPGLEPLLDQPIEVDFNMSNGQIANIATTASVPITMNGNGSFTVDNASLLRDFGPFANPTPDPLGVFAATDKITFKLDGTTPLTQFSGVNSLAATDQDGSAPGALQTFTISTDGVITGVFSNGRTQSIAQIAIATFSNPSGLEKLEGSMYRPSANSGLASVGQAGLAGRGSLAGGTLEMSNVDLAAEFTNLIVAQRGFQANTRVITASDEVLSDLVQMKR